jgi:hypothetical protein
MRQRGWKIVLLIDNAPVYLILDEIWEKLDSVKVKFLPPNTTTTLQPCDTGIIHSFKCHYKRFFIQNQIDIQDSIVEVFANYNIFEVLQNSAKA